MEKAWDEKLSREASSLRQYAIQYSKNRNRVKQFVYNKELVPFLNDSDLADILRSELRQRKVRYTMYYPNEPQASKYLLFQEHDWLEMLNAVLLLRQALGDTPQRSFEMIAMWKNHNQGILADLTEEIERMKN